ncbi:hypothetical protein QBC39DRAFT_156294 [Podospora conica]|nr:hypothetical protein QBC39DRAFT_156294 [Schizothecium conicum]
MSSPPQTQYPRPPFRSYSFLRLQGEPPLAPKGHGALASLIRERSVAIPEDVAGESDAIGDDGRRSERRISAVLNAPNMRSLRLIGNSNPRYRWERYWTTEDKLKTMRKPIREYYERINHLVQQYLYIDRLLDSSLPHDLLNEYPATIPEEGQSPTPPEPSKPHNKVKRTPKDIYRPTETTPLFSRRPDEVLEDDDGYGTRAEADESSPEIPWLEDELVDHSDPIVTVAIYVNFAANLILLIGKLIVVLSVPSISVLASLVDAMLDFLSTVIVWITTFLISRQDQYRYPIGRRRLEPLGVLIFSVIMVVSFTQVALQALAHLASPDHTIIQLGSSAILIMMSTVLIKGACWLWCRLIKNSSVQALASDASTDVIFNLGSIAFPIIGFYAKIWWLDALGGLLLSLIVIFNWSQTSYEHIQHLSGFSATADQRNILLYLTMRFAKSLKIQGLQAYHAGDKLNVEVDIILDPKTPLKDSHDLGESLQYVLESVPIVDRAFVHIDYQLSNWLPTHMEQQAS